jgi:hypothetical protein
VAKKTFRAFFMVHVAMQDADHSGKGGRAVSSGEHVSDEQYNAAPA